MVSEAFEKIARLDFATEEAFEAEDLASKSLRWRLDLGRRYSCSYLLIHASLGAWKLHADCIMGFYWLSAPQKRRNRCGFSSHISPYYAKIQAKGLHHPVPLSGIACNFYSVIFLRAA